MTETGLAGPPGVISATGLREDEDRRSDGVIEAAMYGVLGALAAGLVALILIPPFWRRAMRLNRRDIEASLPTTRAEIDAFRDQLRAGFAVQARQLEQTIETFGDRLAARDIELGHKQQIITHLTRESSVSAEGLGLLEQERDVLQTKLATREAQVTETDEARKAAEKRIVEIEARLDAARQQLEAVVADGVVQKQALAARDAELVLLRGEIAAAAKATGQSSAMVLEMAELRTALASEQMRREVAEGEARAAEAGRRAFDVELQAGAVALAGLREQLAEARSRVEALSSRLVEAEASGSSAATLADENTALAARIAALEASRTKLIAESDAAAEADGSDMLRQKLLEIGAAVARLSAPMTAPQAEALPQPPALASPPTSEMPAPTNPAPVLAEPAEGGSIVALLPAGPIPADPPAAERAAAPPRPQGLAERIRALQQTSKAG